MTKAERVEQLERYAASYADKERRAEAEGRHDDADVWKHWRVNAERVLARLRAQAG